MATMVLTDFSGTFGGTDLSDHIKSATISYEAEVQDETAMGDSTRTNLGGLKNWTIEVEFLQDYAASSVDATMFANVGSTMAFVGKPTSGSVSSTNPSYSGTALLTTYQPIGGTVGELHMTSVSFVSAGDLTRATS